MDSQIPVRCRRMESVRTWFASRVVGGYPTGRVTLQVAVGKRVRQKWHHGVDSSDFAVSG
jgi:hypothetical protein